MDTIVMNSGNSKTSDPHRPLVHCNYWSSISPL